MKGSGVVAPDESYPLIGASMTPSETEYCTVQLTKGKNAIVDAEDYERISQFNWVAILRPDGHYVAARWIGKENARKVILMHREVYGALSGQMIDHVNRNTLDNRRANLRTATYQENARNRGKHKNGRSRFKGAYKYDDYWHSRIMINRKALRLGNFPTEEQAARAYDEAAKKYFGEFACLNFKD